MQLLEGEDTRLGKDTVFNAPTQGCFAYHVSGLFSGLSTNQLLLDQYRQTFPKQIGALYFNTVVDVTVSKSILILYIKVSKLQIFSWTSITTCCKNIWQCTVLEKIPHFHRINLALYVQSTGELYDQPRPPWCNSDFYSIFCNCSCRNTIVRPQCDVTLHDLNVAASTNDWGVHSLHYVWLASISVSTTWSSSRSVSDDTLGILPTGILSLFVIILPDL